MQTSFSAADISNVKDTQITDTLTNRGIIQQIRIDKSKYINRISIMHTRNRI